MIMIMMMINNERLKEKKKGGMGQDKAQQSKGKVKSVVLCVGV